MVRFCEKCGNRLNDGDRACSNCGALVTGDIDADGINKLYNTMRSNGTSTNYTSGTITNNAGESWGMFGNIGAKIKALAAIICWMGIIVFVIIGIFFLSNDSALTGLLVIVVGSILSWTSSFVLYGFGELIHRVCSIDEKISSLWSSTATVGAPAAPLKAVVEKRSEAGKMIKCPECGSMENSAHTHCYKCGADLYKKSSNSQDVSLTGGWSSKDWE